MITRITKVKNMTIISICLDCGRILSSDSGFHFCINKELNKEQLLRIFRKELYER